MDSKSKKLFTIVLSAIILFVLSFVLLSSYIINPKNDKTIFANGEIVMDEHTVNLEDYDKSAALTGEELIDLKHDELGKQIKKALDQSDEISDSAVNIYIEDGVTYVDVKLVSSPAHKFTDTKLNDIAKFIESSVGVAPENISIHSA